MGYYTDYYLSVENVPEAQKGKLNEDILAIGVLEEWGDGYSGNAKWYDHEDDLRDLSLHYPDVLFTLSGDGEVRDDMWVKYFKYGKMQYCPAEITFPPYDEQLLE